MATPSTNIYILKRLIPFSAATTVTKGKSTRRSNNSKQPPTAKRQKTFHAPQDTNIPLSKVQYRVLTDSKGKQGKLKWLISDREDTGNVYYLSHAFYFVNCVIEGKLAKLNRMHVWGTGKELHLFLAFGGFHRKAFKMVLGNTCF